jgi:hypothetical protein
MEYIDLFVLIILDGVCVEMPGVTQAQCDIGVCDKDNTIFDLAAVCNYIISNNNIEFKIILLQVTIKFFKNKLFYV